VYLKVVTLEKGKVQGLLDFFLDVNKRVTKKVDCNLHSQKYGQTSQKKID